jgi:hypothetical protein
MRTEPLARDIREKTLEAWVLLRNLDQRGGGVISIEHGVTFDAIVFGEIQPAKWIAGSEWTHRANGLVGSVETAKPTELIHMAIVYDLEGGITTPIGSPRARPSTSLNRPACFACGSRPSIQPPATSR